MKPVVIGGGEEEAPQALTPGSQFSESESEQKLRVKINLKVKTVV